MSKRCGLTLTELMIVVIIIGILAGLALPHFTRAFEAAKAEEAVAALHQIYSAERFYRLREGTYYPPGPSYDVEYDLNTINQVLHLDLATHNERSWDYSIEAPAADRFRATAIRHSGSGTAVGKKMMISESGQVTNNQ